MLRTSCFRLGLGVLDAPVRGAVLSLILVSGSALACTAADAAAGAEHDAAEEASAGIVRMTPAARLDPRASMAPAEGLKMRVRQQDTLLSAYLAPSALGMQARPMPSNTDRAAAVSERATTPQPKPDAPTDQGYKPLAMLAAALALMVSIALRRSGKR